MAWNGAGRFRVLLNARRQAGSTGLGRARRGRRRQMADAAQIAGPRSRPPLGTFFPALGPNCPTLDQDSPSSTANSLNLQPAPQGFTRYVAAWDGLIDIPADGGYTFPPDGPRWRAPGDRRYPDGQNRSALCAGLRLAWQRRCATTVAPSACAPAPHTLHIEGLHSVSQGSPRILWEGPSLPLTDSLRRPIPISRHTVSGME